MARSCSICSRSDAGAINELLVGRPARSVAAELGLSARALQRHAASHVDTTADPVASAPDANPFDEFMASLRVRALTGNNSAIAREYRLLLVQQAMAKNAAVQERDFASEPEWVALRARLLAALEPFPEAKIAVADAIAEVGA